MTQNAFAKLARGLGFQIDQVESEDGGETSWRYLAKLGTADALEVAHFDVEESDFESEEKAAQAALLVLGKALIEAGTWLS